MSNKLTDKVAIVTGASKGIGKEIAIQLAKEGASVVVNYSASQEEAEKIVEDILKQGGKAIAVQANLSHPDEIEKLFTATLKAFNQVDILVNNAGIYEFKPIEEITLEHYHKIFDLNVLGLLLTIKEAVKHLKSSGSIINISSVVSTSTPANSAVYSASKAAVDAITRSLSKELGSKNIRINSLNPGMVETEGTHDGGFLNGDMRREVEAVTPLKRIGQPQDIAPAVIFLASDESGWITGEALYVSGGYR